MSKALKNKIKLEEIVSVKDFGAVGDGVTNDSTAFNNGLTYVKANGGTLYIPDGTYRVRDLRLESAAKAFSMVGAGKNRVTLKHVDGAGTLLNGPSSSVAYTLQGFTVDCQYSVYASATANHGISIGESSNISVIDIHVKDYKNSAVLIFSATPGTKANCRMVDVSAEGLGNAANGLLFSSMDRCSFENCSVFGLSKNNSIASPGYGMQFKNECRWGSLSDCVIRNCTAGIGMGSDTTSGPTNCVLTNVRIYDCETGLIMGYNKYNAYSNFYIDMESSNAVTYPGEYAIDIQTNSTNNTLSNFIVRNLRSNRSAVILRSGATDNQVHVAELDNINTSGTFASFVSGAQYNSTRLSRMTTPRMRTGNIYSLVSFATESDNNSFVYDNYPYQDQITISGNIAVLRNAVPEQTLILETEAAAATDDLDSVTNTYAQEGQKIIIRPASDARDVVVKHGTGNIKLEGAADFTLTTRRSMICLYWNVTNSSWHELWRVTHT